jgi:hypothetical protein
MPCETAAEEHCSKNNADGSGCRGSGVRDGAGVELCLWGVSCPETSLAGYGCGEFPLDSSGVAVWTIGTVDCSEPAFPPAFSGFADMPLPAWTALTLREALRVGRRMHLRFLWAHRLHGNFLSHLVFVRAQFVQAIGVLPGCLGINMLGMPSLLSWFLPWTV